MSVKIMGMVWDLDLRSNRKFILLAYSDHADHDGKNIFPSIHTIAKKTGYTERNIQMVTRQLEKDGYLVPEGVGRKGTNRWRIPLDVGGEKISPLQNPTEKGENPSGENPSGEKFSPDSLNRPEPSINSVVETANETVDQILELEKFKQQQKAKGKTYDNRERFAESDWVYLDTFVKATGMKPLVAKVNWWGQAFQEWHSLGVGVGDILEAIQIAQNPDKGFLIGSPHSLTNTLNRIVGKRNIDTSTDEDPEQAAWDKLLEKQNG